MNRNLYETIKALEQAWCTKFTKKEIENIIKNYNAQMMPPQPPPPPPPPPSKI